ncbi:kinase-like protein [Lophiostoma macrostomum CBS 122681]|uniref:Kinase-like protein n=1 Tax=Lophiostoma macrostomum CBS 122681 TaxID=1314788 RepID=A0A6A6SN57_9PLEO|nr:kinase-like protein [Lophiostoma macrostomum CBS 122681]
MVRVRRNSSDSSWSLDDLQSIPSQSQKSLSYHNTDDDFVTARSVISRTTYHTASGAEATSRGSSDRLEEELDYSTLLRCKSLWPIDPLAEKDWSGRGQHAVFLNSERKTVDAILEVQDILGSTRTAVVQSVLCRRILLARKTIQCNQQLPKDKAIDEVSHIFRLQHSHIVQVIGTYVMGTSLSILLYPVADYNLDHFLNRLSPDLLGYNEWNQRKYSLRRFFGCLSHAVCHIHSRLTKHMDIKPQNILVRRVDGGPAVNPYSYRVYITDFGIARSYTTLDDSETEGYTLFTRKWSAPEVVDKRKRGLPADIFSLGCVFIEIAAALARAWSSLDTGPSRQSHGFWDTIAHVDDVLSRNEYNDTSYQANIVPLQNLLEEVGNEGRRPSDDLQHIWKITSRMIEEDAARRPSAQNVATSCAHGRDCCRSVPEPLTACRMNATTLSAVSGA